MGVYFNQRDNSLDIPSVGTLHEAVYTCTASNAAGRNIYFIPTHYEKFVFIFVNSMIFHQEPPLTMLRSKFKQYRRSPTQNELFLLWRARPLFSRAMPPALRILSFIGEEELSFLRWILGGILWSQTKA